MIGGACLPSTRSLKCVSSRDGVGVSVLGSTEGLRSMRGKVAGVFQLRASSRSPRLKCMASDGNRAVLEEELRPLRARVLKQRLSDLGVDSSECFDKDSLLSKLVSVMLETEKTSPNDMSSVVTSSRSPLFWTQAASMFSGIQTQQGDYCGLTMRFPQLNSEALSLIVDTASSVNIITPQVAQQLGAPRTNIVGHGVAGTGQLGGAYEVLLGPAQLHLSETRVMQQMTALVMELPTAPGTAGILGLPFLNEMDAVDFVWGQRPGYTDLYPRGSLDSTSWNVLTTGMQEVQLGSILNGLLYAEVNVISAEGGAVIRMKALVDTGAAFSVMNQAGAEACGVPVARPGSGVEPMWVAGADGNSMQMKVSEGAVRIEMQGLPVGFDVHMLIGDLPAFGALGLGGSTPSIILGLDAFLQRPRLLLSTSARRMWL